MKKTFIIVFILLSSTVSASKINLICKDIEVGGFEGDDNYNKFKLYQKTTFDIELDIENKTIISDFINYENSSCDILMNLEDYDDFIYCNQFAYSFNLNLNNYKFTRSPGFGYVMADNDDIGIAYGTCKPK